MDFGVARSTDDAKARAPGGRRGARPEAARPANAPAGQTMAGIVVGTVAYMAPEQARAEPVDQRADIYAFGLILYDLLLGRARASHAESAFEELNARMVQAPPPPRTADPSIPEALDRIVTRCIQPDAGARYPSIADMLAELERARRQRPAAADGPPPHVAHGRRGGPRRRVAGRRDVLAGARARPCPSSTSPSRCSSRTSRTGPATRRSTARWSRC